MRNIKRALIFFAVCSILLANCSPSLKTAITSTLTPTVTSSPVITQTKTSISNKIAYPTPSSSATPTSSPTSEISFTSITTTFQQSGKWNFSYPYSNPDLSGTLQTTSDGYQLDPAFHVNTIEMSYQWGGLGDPVLDYQRIDRRGVDFWRGSSQVSTKVVNEFIQSISHLHLQPQMVNSITHTDDYPIWTIEIKSSDGRIVLLSSKSNGPDYAPWNVIYNGQIYSQFDGQIGKTLSKLFQVMEGQPMAWTSSGSSPEGYMTVDSIGWPGQLSDGFSGLLALQNGFHYWPDPEKGELQGYVKGRSSINGTGNMIFGSITKLTNVEVDVTKGRTVSCALKPIESDDPAAFMWQFTCPVGKPNSKGAYKYPIRVTFATDKNRIYTQSGELFGKWEQGVVIPIKQVPEEIKITLDSSPALQDLMTDHQMYVFSFQSTLDPTKGNIDHRWTATVVFLGQVRIEDRVIRYSITSDVSIEDSQLVQWSLDRKKLQALLQDVINQNITRRFLDGNPDLLLNLYYRESLGDTWFRKMYLWECANIPTPTEKVFPSEEQPLRGFAFNQSMDFGGMQIMLLNGKPRLLSLWIQRSVPEDSIWISLLPPELQTQDAQPQIVDFYGWSPTVLISWNTNASEAEDIEKYNILAQNLPGKKEMQTWGFTTKPVALNISEDGTLSLVDCGISKK